MSLQIDTCRLTNLPWFKYTPRGLIYPGFKFFVYCLINFEQRGLLRNEEGQEEIFEEHVVEHAHAFWNIDEAHVRAKAVTR